LKLRYLVITVVLAVIAMVATGCDGNSGGGSAKFTTADKTVVQPKNSDTKTTVAQPKDENKTVLTVHRIDREDIATITGTPKSVQWASSRTFIQYTDRETAVIDDTINVTPGKKVTIRGVYDKNKRVFSYHIKIIE